MKEKFRLAGQKIADTMVDERFILGINIGVAVVVGIIKANNRMVRRKFIKKAEPIERQYLEHIQSGVNECVLEILRRK